MDKCVICDRDTGFLEKRKIANDEAVCLKCFEKAAHNLSFGNLFRTKQLTAEDIRNAIRKSGKQGIEVRHFVATKTVGDYIAIDEKRELIKISPKRKSRIHDYQLINGFELLEDGETIISGGLGKALVGGALFGSTGAIVGGVTGQRVGSERISSLRIKLNLNDMNNPVDYINFIRQRTNKNSRAYRKAYSQAQECLSILDIICKANEKQAKPNDPAYEIMKYKGLLDAGAITEEEYEAKKKELLEP